MKEGKSTYTQLGFCCPWTAGRMNQCELMEKLARGKVSSIVDHMDAGDGIR